MDLSFPGQRAATATSHIPHNGGYIPGPRAGKSDTWLQIFQNDSKICEAEVTLTPLINKICKPWINQLQCTFLHFEIDWVLWLLLATLTTQFSLNCKRQSCERNQSAVFLRLLSLMLMTKTILWSARLFILLSTLWNQLNIFSLLQWIENMFTESSCCICWWFKNQRVVLWIGGSSELKFCQRQRKCCKMKTFI